MVQTDLKKYVENLKKVKPSLSWAKLTACENIITDMEAHQMYKDQMGIV